MPASSIDRSTYLARLGYAASPAPTLATLRELQRRHTATFAFETIACMLGEPVPVDMPSLQRKLLHDGRGGYCYELNRLFFALLRDLGFQARSIAGRVLMGGAEDDLPARTHMALLVAVDGVDHLVDVGFGGMVPTAPLRLDVREPQFTPHEQYRLDLRDDGYLLRARIGDEWRAMYVFDLQPQADIDHVVGNWYVSTHPDSPFQGELFVARTGEGLRRTLNNTSFAVHRTHAPSLRRELAGPDEVLAVLEDEFGLRLPAGRALRDAIARKFDANSGATAASRAGGPTH